MISSDANLETRPHRQPTRLVPLLLPWLVLAVVCLDISGLKADDLPWYEQRYIEMLSRRNLDSLARSHAVRRRDRATDPNEKALWQLTLAELGRKQIWFVDSKSRSEILKQILKDSVFEDKVTDPVLRFKLQLESSKVVLAESNSSLITAEASQLYGGRHKVDPDVAAARRDQLSKEIERLESAFRQVSGRNSLFRSEQKRAVRDDLRLMMAKLKCQHFHWHVSSIPTLDEQLLNQRNAELDGALRATRNRSVKVQLLRLMTEMASRYSDAADYHSRRLALLSEKPDLRPTELDEFQIRFLLRQKQVKQADECLARRSPLTRLEEQKLLWLAAEIAVGQADQAKRLEDPSLISSVGERLQVLNGEVNHGQTGVLIDAARACLKDANRILEFGPEVASTLKQVDRYRQRGRAEQALQLVNLALKQLPANQRKARRGALMLTATELHIGLKQWSQAILVAEAAVKDFSEPDMISQAAAADLLKCFALSQIISKQPSGRDAYLTALQEHCHNYADSGTAATATAWLLKLTSTSESESESEIAIEVALDRLNRSTDQAERSRLIAALDQEFWQILTSDSFQLDPRLPDWFSKLRKVSSATSGEQQPLPNRSQVEIAFALVVNDANPSEWNDWRQQLASQKGNQPGIETELRFQLLTFIIDAKLSVAVESLESSRETLLNRSPDDLKKALWFLQRVIQRTAGPKIQAGDIVLARTIDRIVIRLLTTSQQPATTALKSLPAVAYTASLTGDQVAVKRVMASISLDTLSVDSVIRLAPMLARLSAQPTMSEQLKGVLMEFWQRLMKNQPAGSELWLEGLVQIGRLATGATNKASVLRQFRTANVLYPDWGTPERRAAALDIMAKLQP